MIKYYSYYNCGGYKDMYIGSDSLGVDATYFVPLLPVWKGRNKPGDQEKIERAEAVFHIGLISNIESYDFPHECNILFSHGGYKAIYKTLSDGTSCLCIREMDSNSRDEEGRATPFNFLFIADGEESISKLDYLAISYLNDSKQIEHIIQESISYDPILNAIKFDLQKLDELFGNEESSRIFHIPGKVIYLKAADSRIAIKELDLKKEDVDAFYNEKNIVVSGVIRYESPTISEEYSDSHDGTIECEKILKDVKSDDITEETGKDESGLIDNLKQVEQKSETGGIKTDEEKSDIEGLKSGVDKACKEVSLLSGEISSLKQLIQCGFKESEQRMSEMENLMNDINKRFDLRLNWKYFKNLSPKEIMAYLLVLIVGTVLGALLF